MIKTQTEIKNIILNNHYCKLIKCKKYRYSLKDNLDKLDSLFLSIVMNNNKIRNIENMISALQSKINGVMYTYDRLINRLNN